MVPGVVGVDRNAKDLGVEFPHAFTDTTEMLAVV